VARLCEFQLEGRSHVIVPAVRISEIDCKSW
jgi:hypothetical protein